MKPGALRRVYLTHQHIICSLNLCKYKHFICKSLIISVLNKTRYNSICIKGVNSHYFPVISIYFHVLYIKTQEKKTDNLQVCCMSVWNFLFFVLHVCCMSVCMSVLLLTVLLTIIDR